MFLSKIEVNHFRNYKKEKIKLDKHINIFIGNNAQGKTNILESIYVLALTKSHRYGIDNNLIQHNYDSCKIKGTIKDNNNIKDLEIILNKNKKIVSINNKEIKKISDYVTNMKIIMFCPDDLDVIKGSPQIRRNLLNIQLSQLFETYIQYLNEYNKILKNRNEYLKMLSINNYTDYRYLEILNDKLCERAKKIYLFRKIYLDKINDRIGKIFENITGIEGLSIKYVNNIDYSLEKEDLISEYLKNKLSKNLKREISQGTTLYGPHRDDFEFYINNEDIKVYGSQGQQRMAIIAFKLAEIEIFKEILNTNPILLLDDIFSELDISKRQKLLSYIPENIQTIITTTDLKNIKKSIIEKAKIFNVLNGTIVEKVGRQNG